MGTSCRYIKELTAFSLTDIPCERKPWLKYYGNMSEKIEYNNGSIYDMFTLAAKKYPNNDAMDYFNTTYTYKQVHKSIDTVARSLKKMNIVKDECVTICMPNIPETIFLVYAINKIGAISNVIHPLSSSDEIKHAMEITQSSTIFTTDASYSNVLKTGAENIVVCDVSNSMPTFMKIAYNVKSKKQMEYDESSIKWNDFIDKKHSISDTKENRTKDDPAIIIYSGGTTGESKAIVLTNLCFNSIASQCYHVCKEARAGNSILSALPIFHGFGLCVSVHVPLMLGLKCILIPKINVKKLNSLIKKKKPNLLPAIPTMLNAITNNKSAGKKSLESVQVILSGGDYLSDDLRKKVLTYFNECGSNAHIQVGYGLSEATAFIAATSENIEESDNLGIPNPDTIVKICEPETNEEIPDGEIGEICVNGPSVMMGYLNDKDATDNAIRTHKDGTQWLHTGDLGFIDDGVLHFTSRLKRMIISNGYNIYPTELEKVISKCKYVAQNVVVGIKDKIRQEAPKVVIVLKKGVERTTEIENEIREYCKKNIAKNAQPTEYEFTDQLPTTKIGKVNYRKFEAKNDKADDRKENHNDKITK